MGAEDNPEAKHFEGKVTYKGEIKTFKNNFHSFGFRIAADQEGVFHNCGRFARSELAEIYSKFQKGDTIKWTEMPNEQGYSNVTSLEKVGGSEEKQTTIPEATEDDRKKAMDLQRECVEDALMLSKEKIPLTDISYADCFNPNEMMEGIRRSRISFIIERNRKG